ncbi:hypothetical protein ACEQ8H_007172 [Pleosporales sp. CAS-2024a]
MTYRIEPVSDSDLPHLIPPLFQAMGPSYEFMNAMWPDNQTPSGQAKIAARMLAIKRAAPHTHWTQAVDTTTNAPVGFAMWTAIDADKPAEKDVDAPADTWKDEAEKKYAVLLHRSLLECRRRAIRENEVPIMMLNMMAVWVQHQRKGIGKMLLDWGLKMADEKNALCILEGTQIGSKLYRKGGFTTEQEIVIDAGPEYAHKPKDHVFFMMRPRKRPLP